MKIRWLYYFLCCIHQICWAQLSLDDIFLSGKYKEKHPESFHFLKDERYYIVQEGNAIVKKETITGKLIDTVFARIDSLKNGKFTMSSFSFSSNENYLLISGNREGIYRRSFRCEYFIYDVKKQIVRQMLFPGSGSKQNNMLSNAEMSPDENKIAFTFQNNLFLYYLKTSVVVQITFDGKNNVIINGSTDWVYEEEFEFTKGYEWSPDSKKIAFLKFDESEVPEYNMQKWTGLYPENYTYKYPKAGENNSLVSMKIYDVENNTIISIPTDSLNAAYIPRFGWKGKDSKLLYITLNRLQTNLTIEEFDFKNGVSNTVLSKQFEKSIELDNEIHFYSKRNSIILSGKVVNDNGLFEMKGHSNFHLNSLTNFKDCEIEFLDEKRGYVYFTSSSPSPKDKLVYRLNIKTKKAELISSSSGINNIKVSPQGEFYWLINSSSGIPSRYSLYNSAKALIRDLEVNGNLLAKIEDLNLPKQKFFYIKTSSEVLQSWIIKPVDFDSTKKYPLIMYVYGGPGSQMVKDGWGGANFLWHQYLVSQGFIVACVDGRGTGGKDDSFRNCTYRKLGEYETIDQIQSAKYFSSLPFINKDKIGIWGWSFGGYLSTLSLLLGNDIFKAAVAVAPVTSWRFYDAIYTERYLGMPKDNVIGYDQNSPLNHADKLKGKYLLIHGTSDDNVQIQNTFAMQEALIKSGKDFETFIYPNKSHGISGGNTRLHLYTKMLDFWNRNLK